MTDNALQKAEAAVKAAETDTVAVQLALAAVELAKTAQQQASRQEVCQHQHKEPMNVGKWIGMGLAVCVGSVGLALGFLAVAIAAPCATACLLVLRSMYRDYLKGR